MCCWNNAGHGTSNPCFTLLREVSVAMSEPRNPYPGALGVVAEGALADLLLVDGDPLANIGLLSTPETSLTVIMKDGVIYRNTLAR